VSPDVILTTGTASIAALRAETQTVPVVFTRVSDPVGQGFVDNLAKPGGNVTGFSNFEPAIAGKWLQTLKEIAGDIVRVVVIANPETSALDNYFRAVVAVSGTLGIDTTEQFRGAASYVHRILRGEKPGDLPVQAPVKFELVINLTTAKALGLTISPALLSIADDLIE
jgi:ABC-type uncharacterized transport system substrate-binding protein